MLSIKKYLDDKAIENAHDDKFGHLSLAKQISEIIKEQTADIPVNIGLFGKWGVGKSSVVELLEKDVLKNEIVNGEIKFIRVNVWKYQSINSIRNKIFYQIAKELEVEKDISKLYESSTTTMSNLDYNDFLTKYLNRKFFTDNRDTLITYLVLFVISLFLLWFIYQQDPKIGFIANAIASIVTSAAVLRIGLDYFFKTFLKSTTIQSKPFESEEQFEHAAIDLFNSKKYKEMKKILFIDDLDRCSSDKVLNTLETIKTFLQIDNCVFIVACDHDLIKKAVVDSNKEFNYTDKDGANYLEKFFQHFIYLPPYLPSNLRDFTKKLITESALTIAQDLKEKIDTVIYIIAYRDIINPRKIKVLMNSFIFDYYTIKAKEEDSNHLIQTGLITSHPERLAILTVLKVDFPLFVNDLVIDPTLCSKIAYGIDEVQNINLKEKYFSKDDQIWLPYLREYLFLVKDWIPRDFTPYLFVSIESAEFQQFTSVDYLKYLSMIRNGDLKIIDELSKLKIDDRQTICTAIGNLQYGLSNIVEKRNATAILTHIIALFPECTSLLENRDNLFSFKHNYEAHFPSQDNLSKINESGLRLFVIAFYNIGLSSHGNSLLSIAKRGYEGLKFLFFLLNFLSKQVYTSITSIELQQDLIKFIEESYDLNITEDNYKELLADIIGIVDNPALIEEYLGSLIHGLPTLSIEEYNQQLIDTPREPYNPDFFIDLLERLSKIGLIEKIIEYVDELFNEDKLYAIYIIALEPLLIEYEKLGEHVLSKEVNNIQPRPEEYYELLLQIASTASILEIKDNALNTFKIVIASLEIEESVSLETSLIRNIGVVLDSDHIQQAEKTKFLLELLDAFPKLTSVRVSLGYILDEILKSNVTEQLRTNVTLKFVRNINIIESILEVETFLGKYNRLIRVDNDEININFVNQLYDLNDKESAPSIAAFVKSRIEKQRKPVDLKFIADAIGLEKNANQINFSLDILSANTSFTKATKDVLKQHLPNIFSKTFTKPGETKKSFFYAATLRAKVVEILLTQTDYAFANNIFEYLKPHSIALINGFMTVAGLTKLSELMIKENDPASCDFENQKDVLNRLCLINKRIYGQNLPSIVGYLTNIVKMIVIAKRSTIKSELNSVFQVLQSQFKKYDAEVNKSTKLSMDKLFSMALAANPNLKRRLSKLERVFTPK